MRDQSLTQTLTAYLSVLGEGRAQEALRSSRAEVLGCLHRLESYLQSIVNSKGLQSIESKLLELVRDRERINGVKPFGDPELVAATEKTAKALRDYLDNPQD